MVLRLNLLLISALLLYAPAAFGDAPSSGRGPLDGMTFVGKFGPADKPLDTDDRLHFDDGQFWSAICVKCGFHPGRYWVREDSEGMHFLGELVSERGRFRYHGRVKNGRIEVRINWRKERWYWTIDRDFRFEGTLENADAAPSAQDASSVAAAVGPERPESCRL